MQATFCFLEDTFKGHTRSWCFAAAEIDNVARLFCRVDQHNQTVATVQVAEGVAALTDGVLHSKDRIDTLQAQTQELQQVRLLSPCSML